MELEKYLGVMIGQEADALKRLIELDTEHKDKVLVMGVIMKRLNSFYKNFVEIK